jgi:hypothetical protein
MDPVIDDLCATLGCAPEAVVDTVRRWREALRTNYTALQNFHSECWATCSCPGCEVCEPGGAYDQARAILGPDPGPPYGPVNQATGEGRDG